MSENSIRELLVLKVIEELETITWVKMVKRVRPTMVELENYPTTMLPLIVVEAGLPVPVEKKSSRRPGGIDIIMSNLTIKIFCYMLENTNPDSLVSNYLDDIWKKMYVDVLKGNLSIETNVKPHPETLVFSPYTAFSVDVEITYVHDTNGI